MIDNIYLKVFLDTFLSYFSLGIREERLFFIALQFKNQIALFTLISFIGFIFSISTNYLIGRIIKKYSKKQKYNSFISFLNRNSTYIIPISIANHLSCQFFSIIYGSLNLNFRRFLLYSFIGRSILIIFCLIQNHHMI